MISVECAVELLETLASSEDPIYLKQPLHKEDCNCQCFEGEKKVGWIEITPSTLCSYVNSWESANGFKIKFYTLKDNCSKLRTGTLIAMIHDRIQGL